jgi:hypothetical protein
VRAGFSLGALSLGTLVACSSASPTPATACDPCGDTPASGGPAADAAALRNLNVNPDGVAYPDPPGGYGRSARRGTTPGSVIRNFVFLGYPNSDESHGLQKIALADYYDPCNKRSKVLHLGVAAVWCVPCNEETQALVAAKAELASERVVVIQALSDGPKLNVGATQSDLNYWIMTNHPTFTEMLDPELANLGGFFDAAAVPWNADIDPRTMEIVDDGTGWAGTVDSELAPALKSLSSGPMYPIAVKCD